MKRTALVLGLLFFCACGGGGGGSSSGNFAGVYRVTLSLQETNCPFDADEILNLTHRVNQNDLIIALDSGSASFAGNVEPDGESFTVGRQTLDQGCEFLQAFAYGPATGDSDYNVGFAQDGNCGFATCRIIYAGVANRIE
jgi:hypothetical protein